MFRRLAPVLALCGALLATRVAVADDAADVKTAAAAFFKALENGNAADAKAVAAGTDKQVAVLDVLVPVVSAFKQLENAAVKKWGEEGRKALSQGEGGGGFDFANELQKSTVKVEGDAATVTAAADAKAGGPKKDPMKLKKVEGKWKVDMSSIPTEQLDDPRAKPMFKAMADAAKSTAAEIDQGKHANPEAAKKAVGEKMMAGMIGAGLGGPGAGPGIQPPAEEPKK